jgi:hypothetical protein
MYTVMTREYWDGDLMAPRYSEYSSADTLAQVLKRFDFNGGCWESVEIRDDDRVIYSWKKKHYANGIDALKYQLNVLAQALVSYAHVALSNEEKSNMVNTTISALNCGSDEAMDDAYCIKVRAIVSGDEELIEKIEYLHEVL